MDYDENPASSRTARRGPGAPAGKGSGSGYRAQPTPSYQVQLEQMEADAYLTVLRAFGAQSENITWAKERLMSDLRTELNIDDVLHRQLLDQVHSDSTVQQICRWKKSQAGGGSFRPPSPPSLEPGPGPPGPQARKKQKTGGPLAPPPPIPSQAKPEAVAALARPATIPKRGAVKGKGRKGRGGRSTGAATQPLSDEVVDEPVHPWIGKRIKTRWAEEDGTFQFYESVISDYRPDTGEHGLLYDMGTPLESWEWVDLNKMPKQDIIWLPGPPVPLVPRPPLGAAAGRGVSRSSALKRPPPNGRGAASPSPAGRGRGQTKGQTAKGRRGAAKGPTGPPHEDVQNGSSDMSEPAPDSFVPLEHIVKVDNIEREENLQKLEEAKRLAKEREEALRRALAEVENDSSDDDDDEGGEPSSRGRDEEEPSRVESDNKKDNSQGDEEEDSQARGGDYERESNFRSNPRGEDEEEDDVDD